MKTRFVSIACALMLAAPAGAQIRPSSATPEARAAVTEFARCVVRHSPQKAHAALTLDFTSGAYGRALQTLAEHNRECFHVRATMRAGGLPFAAAMAETLLLYEATPLNVRLMKASATNAPTYSPTDRVAMCVARSDPDNVAALLQSPIASQEETAKANALRFAVSRCSPPKAKLDLTPYALRAMLATASYRLLAAAGVAR